MEIVKNGFKKIILIVLVVIFSSSISIYATYNYLARDVKYTKSDGTEVSVEESLNELYEKFNNKNLNNKNLNYNILFSTQGISPRCNYTISDEDLKYSNIILIVTSMNTAESQFPTSISVTNENVIPISNNKINAYVDYGIYTTQKLYVGVIKNIVKDDVINISGSYAGEICILGVN